MSNDILLFRSYIVIALFVLVPISLIVTLQIYYLLESYISLYFLLNVFTKNEKCMLSYEDYNKLFYLLLDHHKFSFCISSAELFIHLFNTDIDIVYTIIAYSYQKTSFFYIAEYYYLQALDISCNSEVILPSLAKIYLILGNHDKLNIINSRIKAINSGYSMR